MYFVPQFGHAKVYETSIWTPCFQISAKTLQAIFGFYLGLKYLQVLEARKMSKEKRIPMASVDTNMKATPGLKNTNNKHNHQVWAERH